ncbi:uncharacterized protein C7orf57 homolog [Myxocyprinus asiaticus]|uniref:uncharacterized protein C7orf57 homolog n=1 Tax=Myxocyprinus asiaticus TaxID=70543 RepID=UPI0022223206|nr:uncharacterized protein C7orf57 homolog [Myxocyprinus asiaticus]
MAAEPNYRRTKPGVRSTHIANTNGAVGPSSQIPGLSASADITPEERTKGRRVGIQSTDSDYVKLAKQGGQKGLLWHDDPVETKPSSYKPPNWFSDTPDDQESGGKATTPDRFGKCQSKGAAQPLEPPFGTESCPVWERESDDSKKISHATSEMQKISLSQKEIDEVNKFKKTSHEKKKATPVNMSKLLSFGYVEETKKSPDDDDASSITSEQTCTIEPEDDVE